MIADRALMVSAPLFAKPEADDEEYRSRVLLTTADATVELVDRQLRRLQAAADLYRERLESGMEPSDEAD